ncbi:MAG: LPS export ABC transporter permease LptG [Thermodesulfobacteriota bacterium]|nr:LPS export ABC transporter permease LptG [Thermodesulfobacteriota bacterium]
MTIIDRYLTRELLKYFFMVLASVVGIYLTVDFFGRIDDFLDAKLPLSIALEFFSLKVPLIVGQVMPVGVLLAVLIVFGLMAKSNEILALKGGGVGAQILIKPVCAMGLVSSVLLFFLSEVLVPVTTAESNEIWRHEVKGEAAVSSKKKNIWMRADHSIHHVTYFNVSAKTMFDVTLNYFDKDFRLIRRLDARKGVYMGEGWRLFDVLEQSLMNGDSGYVVTCKDETFAKLEFGPEDLSRVAKKPEEMSYGELSAYIVEVEDQGYDATSQKVDLMAKIAYPFVCLIMSVMGAGLALWQQRREGFAANVFYGIVLAFSYWTLHSFCVSLGYGELLPPMVAPWIANGVFACFGAILLFHAD